MRLLQEVYSGPAWHGPSVKEALAGVHAETAAWRLSSDRNSIWDLVLHLSHGRHLLIERITGTPSPVFPRALREPWWPVSAEDTSEASWRADLAMLDDYQERFLAAVNAATPAQLDRMPPGATHTIRDQVIGMAVHDAYHAGQIRLLALEWDQAT